jgi:hypothetical protein
MKNRPLFECLLLLAACRASGPQASYPANQSTNEQCE